MGIEHCADGIMGDLPTRLFAFTKDVLPGSISYLLVYCHP